MTIRDFNVAIREEPDGSFWGEVVELPGCFVSGHSLDELKEVIEEAISLYLTDKPDAGKIKRGSMRRVSKSPPVAVDSMHVRVPVPA